VLLRMAEKLSGWTFEVGNGKAGDKAIAWHALLVRGMGGMAKEMKVLENGVLVLESE
jgi:hypothetical protein